MATHAQYRFFSTLAGVALDAAIEVDGHIRGKEADQKATEKFFSLLKEALAEAHRGDVMSVSSVHRLYVAAVGETDDDIRTVSELLEIFELWIARSESAVASRQMEDLKRFVDEMLAAHSFAISSMYGAIRERRGMAA